MKNINFLLIILITLVSCGSVEEAGKVLRNEKIKTTDEFLVKKRKPLVLPPDYNEIPEPGTKTENKINENEKIKKMLKSTEKNNIKNNSSSTEQSILNKIRK
tara:strand:- start:164 stop:469 length:306 start_codon:yes stop_codon:yes gene_type:complete